MPDPNPGSNPLRILLIAPSMDILGGQAVQASALLKHLRDEPLLEVTFLAMNPRLPGPLRRLQKIKYVRTVFTFLWFLAKLLSLAPRHTIVHVFAAGHYSFLLAPAPCLILARLLGKKSILHYHDGRVEEHLRRWPVARPIIRLAAAVVAPSEYIVEVFARFGIRARTIANIIDVERFHFRKRERPMPVFLHNRGLDPVYNVGCVLRAFQLIQRSFPAASLTIAHDGPSRAELESLAQRLELRNTFFIGQVPHSDTPALYDSADIYLMSPNFDCLPGSVLECFASGLPVVTTEVGGIPYMLKQQQTGLLVPPNDHHALALSAIRLLEEENLATALAANAVKEVRKYQWPSIRNDWVNLYGKLAGRSDLLDSPHATQFPPRRAYA